MGGTQARSRTTGEDDARAFNVEVHFDVVGEEEPDYLDNFELWEEHQEAVSAFIALQTSWRELVLETDKGLIIKKRGLPPEAMEAVVRNLGLCKSKRVEVITELRVMEIAALSEYNK